MLILFDLDDTLIETSKCLTEHALKHAFEVMQSRGLSAPEEAFFLLKELNAKALTSREAIETFWSRFSCQENILIEGLKALKAPLDVPLDPVPGAIELLRVLEKEHTLAIVTLGSPSLQREKMKKAGIQPERFSKIVIGQGSSKKLEYQQLLEEFKFRSADTVVCGDRVSIDLTPAKELGCFTVHFRNGRGLVHDRPKESVDQSITSLNQLQEVFAKYES